MTSDEMQKRTRVFAIQVIQLVRDLPRDPVGAVLGRQILRSATAIGANYHESRHASSRRHFISTMEIAQREARETQYWLYLIAESRTMPSEKLEAIQDECNQLLAILTAAVLTAKRGIERDTQTKSKQSTERGT